MPLNGKDEPIPSKTNKASDMLGFKEIGGIGQLIYHPFRFKDYRLGDYRGDYCAFPICRLGYEPEFPNEVILTGKGLLVSLCNLAHQINNYDNTIPYDQLIIEWFLENMHPYSVDFIYSELNENFDINTFDAEMVEKDGIFEINEFLHDLGKLYNAVIYYVALEDACIGDDEITYDLSQEEKFFESKFTTTPHDDYESLRDTLIDIIPDFTIKLKVDPRSGKIEFSTDVKSVFDIAWFTLARMISEASAPEYKGKPENRGEGIMIRCRNCGRFIIRKSNRQEFCDSDECQKARNARKQKAYRDRKAIEKAQKQRKNT